MFDLPGYVKAKLAVYNPKNIFKGSLMYESLGFNLNEYKNELNPYRKYFIIFEKSRISKEKIKLSMMKYFRF